MGMARHAHNNVGKPRPLFIVLSLSLCIIAGVEAQEKTVLPDELACPVTANLFPTQIRIADSLRFTFPEGSILRRFSITLVHPESKDISVRYEWVPGKDSGLPILVNWGKRTGILVTNGKGRTDCFFLGWEKTDIPENVPCKEFVLGIPEGVLVKEIAFSSLPSEKPVVLCPMPGLEQDITSAYEGCRKNPEDKEKALVLIRLLERITPKYDCRRSYDSEPVPAWWLASNGTSDSWIMWLHRKVLEKNADAFRVYVKFMATSDGYIAEPMADQMSGILHALPLFVLENWFALENDKEQVLGLVRWMHSPENLIEMINIYRDIASKEPNYKSACDEIISILSKNKPTLPQTTSVDAVKKLTAEIDQYVEDNQDSEQKLVARKNPLDHSSPGDSWHWKRIENWDEADEYFKGYWSSWTVAVWTIDSKVAFVKTSQWSDSGDWAIYINYYFDDRGRLLHISTDFRTLIDDLKTLDFQYFDESGQILDHTVDYYAIGDKMDQKLPAKPENMQQPIHDIPVYLKASDLPFYGLINLDRKSTGPVKFGTSKSTARERMCN